MTILYVDDDPDDRQIFEEAVSAIDKRHVCLTAQDGTDALSYLSAGNFPDIIFLDINMPLMDGKQTLVEIKKDKALDNVPIVMFTTSSSQLDIAFCQQYGVDFITKPINLQDFHNTIQKLLSFRAC